MSLLAAGINPIELQREVSEGWIKVNSHPDYPNLKIANYTEQTVWKKHWNPITLACRGLIFDSETWEIIARGFPKFFNFGEGWEPNQPPPSYDLDTSVEAYDKVDGSLALLYFYDDQPWVATRGSFVSPQALHATELFREKYADWRPSGDGAYTALFEIVYPENRIVVDYRGQDDLVLLGSVYNVTGESFNPQYVATKGWPGPRTQKFHKVTTLEHALQMAARTNAEGLVVRLLDGSRTMLKIKYEAYKALHKLVTGVNEKYVWEALKGGASVEEIASPLPDEFHDWVKETATSLWIQSNTYIAVAMTDFHAILAALGVADRTEVVGPMRKQFAEMATKHPRCGYLFMLLDGKDITGKVWDEVEPRGNKVPHKFSQEAA